MKELFEKWIATHFAIKLEPEDFDENDGYRDEQINAMWIGFNGYAILKWE